MTISVTCKKCGKVLKSPAQFAGKPVKCPDCDTINRLPDAAAEVCCLCGADFSSDSNRAKDTKGNLYHRSCYDKKKAEKEASEFCRLCGENFAADPDRVKDNKGNLFHRTCYEKKRQSLRRSGEVCRLCKQDFSAKKERVKDAKGNLFHRDCYNRKKETLDKQRRALREKEKREQQRQEEEKRRREQQEREREKREEEKRQRESKPAAKEKIEPRGEKCELCGESLSSATNRITDLKGHVFHQTCYDNREGGAGGQRSQCQLCGQRFADAANVVKDPHGRYYHRNCYEEEKARLAPLDLSGVPEVDALDEFDDEPPAARARVVASKEPHPTQLPRPPRPSQSAEPQDEFRLAPIEGESKPSGKPPVAQIVERSADEDVPTLVAADDEDIPTLTAADDAGLVPLDHAGLVPVDNAGLVPIDNAGLVPIDNAGLTPIDGSLLQPIGPSTLDPLAGVPLEPLSPGAGGLARGKESMPRWLYTLMGCGAAVPVIVLLYIIVTSILGPSQPATGPVATTEQTSPADVDSTDPTPATSPYSPPVPGQRPGRPPGGPYYEPPGNRGGPPRPGSTASFEGLVQGGGQGLLCFGVSLIIGALLNTVFFRVACSICGEHCPDFGGALLIVGAATVVLAVINFVTAAMLPPIFGLLVIVYYVLVFAGAYTITMRLSFGKALLIAIVQFVMAIVAIVVLVGGIIFVLVVVTSGGS